jgi:peptidoglycan/xylan/chitin deacetylase (PgdA/CDA1 family)
LSQLLQSGAFLIALLLFQPFNANALGTDTSPERYLSCNCVAFRLDDVQDYFLDQVQIEVIRTFSEANASITVGIIGNYIGDDDILTSFLKEEIRNGGRANDGHSEPVVEVANHGWNHEDFTQFDEAFQSQLLQESNQKILDRVGVKPVVFIPPFNTVNNDTIAASLENDIHYISANTTSYPLSKSFQRGNASDEYGDKMLYSFPSSASTGDLNDDNTQWIGYSHQDTFKAIESSLDGYGYAVVTMHPQEYSLRNGLEYINIPDHEQLLELKLLIKMIQNADIHIVTISQIRDDLMVPEFTDYSLLTMLTVSIISLMATSWIFRFKPYDGNFRL